MIYSHLADMMKKQGISERKLAEKTGVDRKTIQRCKNDISGSRLIIIKKIADGLGVNVKDMFTIVYVRDKK